MSAALPSVTSAPARWKRYPIYKDSGVEWLGEIPAHWQTKRLKFLAQVRTGVAKGRTLLSTATVDLPYLRVANVQSGYLNLDDISTITVGVDEVASQALKIGDVLMNEGGDYDKLGRGTVWSGQIDSCLHQNHVFAVRPGQTIESQWLASITLTTYAKHFFIIKSKQSTNLASISSTNLAELPVVVPPPAERVAIQQYIDREGARIDALVAKKEQLIELLQEKRTALIGQAVTKGLDPSVPMKDSCVGWLGSIPSHWRLQRLKTVTSLVTSGSRGWAEYYSDCGSIFLRIGNLSRRSIDLNLDDVQHVSPPAGAEGERTLVRPHDVLISITAYIGSVTVVPEDIGEAYVNQHIALTRPCQDIVVPRWLGYYLLSQVGQEQFGLLLYGGTKDGLGLDDVRNIWIVMPPRCEQYAIVNHLDRETTKIDTLIAKVQEHIEKLREYRMALISAAVTGKIDVREEMA